MRYRSCCRASYKGCDGNKHQWSFCRRGYRCRWKGISPSWICPPTSESSVGSYNIAKDKKEYYNRYIRRAPDDISISQKSQWTTISHSSSALWLCVRLFDNYFFLLFFHILYITLEIGSKTHIATNQPGKCGIISILLILYKIEYSHCNADGSNDKWYNNS